MSEKWTMNGMRPTSSIAISIMESLGAKMNGRGGWTAIKAKSTKKKGKK